MKTSSFSLRVMRRVSKNKYLFHYFNVISIFQILKKRVKRKDKAKHSILTRYYHFIICETKKKQTVPSSNFGRKEENENGESAKGIKFFLAKQFISFITICKNNKTMLLGCCVKSDLEWVNIINLILWKTRRSIYSRLPFV